ncbi:DNA-(apurinic or apyrimidinic site) lyase /endonuclease III [Acinetobacter marinus]|uniref:Endonuclease III n=2 Tax=Acinetobacter marinus TaxID=281375 RepID=A0A1G6GY61_9GAMM|nr:DNA-(apurinic or apyrimidinic site) lyase /endonuclease III [Acinetobacter marinus]
MEKTIKTKTVKAKTEKAPAKKPAQRKSIEKKAVEKKPSNSKTMTKAQIQIFFERLREQRPNPETELNYGSPFQLLIAVLLSAQATDVSVNKATDQLFQDAPDAHSMYALGVEKLKNYIKTIGLFNSKAENVIKTCHILIEHYGGEIPQQREQLEALPGVGRKTANVVLNTAFGQPTMAVDTHIFRLGNRTGLAKGKDVLEVEQQLLKRIPTEFIIDAHHWLILHGRYCCIARKPKCGECIVSDVCNWKERFDYGAEIPELQSTAEFDS